MAELFAKTIPLVMGPIIFRVYVIENVNTRLCAGNAPFGALTGLKVLTTQLIRLREDQMPPPVKSLLIKC